MQIVAFLREVLALAAPFWRSDERWRARRLLALLLAIKGATIYVLILQNHWYKDFYNAIEQRSADAFLYQCMVFGGLGLTIAASHVYSHWLGWSLKTHWRSFMVRSYLADWLRERCVRLLLMIENDDDAIYARLRFGFRMWRPIHDTVSFPHCHRIGNIDGDLATA